MPRVPLGRAATRKSCASTPPSTDCSRRRAKRCWAATPPHNADIARRIFAGEAGAYRDLVLLNAGIRIWLAERAPSIEEGIERARDAIDSGAAAAKLEAARSGVTRAG